MRWVVYRGNRGKTGKQKLKGLYALLSDEGILCYKLVKKNMS